MFIVTMLFPLGKFKLKKKKKKLKTKNDKKIFKLNPILNGVS